MKQKDYKFKPNLYNLARPCLKIQNFKRADDVAQYEDPGYNPQYHTHKDEAAGSRYTMKYVNYARVATIHFTPSFSLFSFLFLRAKWEKAKQQLPKILDNKIAWPVISDQYQDFVCTLPSRFCAGTGQLAIPRD